MVKLLYVLCALGAGICNGFQAPVNAALSRFTGVVEGSCVSFSVGALILFVVSLVAGKGNLLRVFDAPPYLWTGGLVGALLVTTMLVVITRVGAAVTLSAVITGQMIAALVIDQIGLLGVPRTPMDLPRLGGLLLMAAGLRLLIR